MVEHETHAARIAELEADNRRLRRLLDQRDAPGELRHRLRSTVAMLRTIIRRSAETSPDVPSYVAHLEDRLDALSRAQTTAEEHGVIELHKLVADELLQYGASEDDRLTMSGPGIELQPRAGHVFTLAVHELAVNAVEHGALGVSGGRVDVAWNIQGDADDAQMTFDWNESGHARFAERSKEGFGTEVLTRMLAYELKAETAFAFQRNGLRCTIRLPLAARTGRVIRE